MLSDGSILVSSGPLHMGIIAKRDGRPLTQLSQEGARLALRALEELAVFQDVIKERSTRISVHQRYPDVVRRMILATQMVDDPDLTPLAAVAGAVADYVADFIREGGATKVIVDNGGDIATRLMDDEVAKVGLRLDVNEARYSHRLELDGGSGIGGVATSGLGGRSFTKGIASAAVAIASTASIADASATVLANSTYVEDPEIRRALAEDIFPDTDITGQWVITHVGALSRQKINKSLRQGVEKAIEMEKKRLIFGSVIAVKGKVAISGEIGPMVKENQINGGKDYGG